MASAIVTESLFRKKAKMFEAFLVSHGAEVLKPTNEYELMRFMANGWVQVIYRKASGQVTFAGDSREAFDAYLSGKPWRGTARPPKKKKSAPRLAAIRERDGGACFFCLEPVAVEDESEEHLVAATHGGPNHISNLFLAHKKCNAEAGHLSAPEKIALHVSAVLRRAMQ
ncbi:HNH endonuclease [Herbaspirillum huttiense]|uniref:HNH endonuclease n=1 Tax=Herbaspirillum huttiense TaxID=863372 RepID=UPI003B3A5837